MISVLIKLLNIDFLILLNSFLGFRSYVDRYQNTINNITGLMGAPPKMGGPLVDTIAEQLEEMCPLEDLEKRRAWRDACLTQLSQMKKKFEEWWDWTLKLTKDELKVLILLRFWK